MFFSLDGIDGVGKSTQVELFCDWLRSEGVEPVTCRDPGSTPLGEKVREILLASGAETPIGIRSEMLLYMAARAQLVDQVIRPALAANKTVVADRYLLANVAYQGYGGGLDPESVWQVGGLATLDIQPTRVFLLDMPTEQARDRIQRERDRMEQQADDYLDRVRAGFLAEAQRHADQIAVIDAARPVAEIHNAIRAIAAQHL